MSTEYTVVHLFSGSGGCSLGFQREGFRTIAAIDFDADACADLDYLLGEHVSVCADIGAMEPADLRRIVGERRPDVLVSTPPCLPANGIVLTEHGPRPISTVRPGDLVLSHRGRYCRVDKVNVRPYVGPMHGIRLVGSRDVEWYTAEHPLWVRTCKWGPKAKSGIGEPRWTPAAEVRAGDRVGFPVPREVPGTAARFVGQFGDTTLVTRRTRWGGTAVVKNARSVDLRPHATSAALWLLLGAYVGDGDRRLRNLGGRYEVRFAVGSRSGIAFAEVTAALTELGLPFYVEGKDDNNVRITTGARALWNLAGLFGDGTASKKIPEAVMGVETECLRAFVRGLYITDGHDFAGGWKLTSISLQLLRDVQRLMLRRGAYGTISAVLKAGRAVIEGREVNISDSYALTFFENPRRATYWFEDGAVWIKVREVHQRDAAEPVWNLEVDEDDTYCSPLIATHNCKGWSKCLPKRSRVTDKYRAMCALAVRGVWLALHAWPEQPPPLVLIENVRGMNIEGRELMRIIESELAEHGYLFDVRVHNVGEVGGLAQNRHRCLLVARDQARVPAFLMVPPNKRVRPVGDELGRLPPPVMDAKSDSMHRLPQLSALNWLRIALIPAGKDWKALPGRVRLGGDATGRRDGKFGVEAWTVTGTGNRVPSGWSAVADPRMNLGPDAHSGILGVEDFGAPAHTVTGNARIQGSWGGVADPRLATPLPVRPGVVARAWTGRRGDHGGRVVDPRLTCSQWSGAYGVCSPDEPSPTIVGHHKHDRAPASYADPRLDYRSPDDEAAGRHSGRGCYGVLDSNAPAPSIRGHMSIRQAPGAIADPRVPWDHAEHGGRPHNYGVQRWDAPASTIKGKQVVQNSRAAVAHPEYPTPTHRVVREADGELVLVGPPIDLDDDRPCYLVIEAEDGTWHRPMTDLELAVLQSLPAYHRGEMLKLRGPSGKRREHIGNMLPTAAAQAIARECRATLDAAADGFQLVGGGTIWVEPEGDPAHSLPA